MNALRPNMDTKRKTWPYLLGVAGYTITDTFLQTWLTFFFVPPPDKGISLVDPKVYGNAFLLARIVEALFNPLIGFGAERTGKPWRFLAIGGLIFDLVGMSLFFLAHPGQSDVNSVLLFCLLPVMTIGQACFIVPYLGLIPKIAPTPKQQVALTNNQTLLILIGVLIGQILSGKAIELFFSGSLQTGALWFLSAATVLMILASLSVRTVQTRSEQNFSFQEMGGILQRNRGFQLLVAALFLFWLGFSMVRSAVTYFVTVLLNQPKEATSGYFGILSVTTLISVGTTRVLAPRLGLRRMMLLASLLFAVILPLFATIGFKVGPFAPITWAQIVFALLGLPLGILSSLQNSIVAEQAEQDALKTGTSKTALFFGVQGLLIKMSYGLAASLLGFLQSTFGYTTAHPLGIQLIGPIAGFLALCAAGLYYLYPKNLSS
jgi:glycoside/pentoside/hexuronide:cation symporter, GPH family